MFTLRAAKCETLRATSRSGARRVLATHQFLSAEDFDEISELVEKSTCQPQILQLRLTRMTPPMVYGHDRRSCRCLVRPR